MGGVGAQTDGGTEKCTLGENTQNLRHQTDEEVAIWGQRSTEEAPREASRDTSQSSSTCLAHSSHLANTFCPEKRDDNVSTHARACTHTKQPEAHGLGRQRQDRQTLLHKGQSDPGDRGETWCCPTMAAVARTRWKQSTFGEQVCTHHPPHLVDRPTRWGTSSVPGPLAPRAKDLSQLGSSSWSHESCPARPLTPQMCPKVW